MRHNEPHIPSDRTRNVGRFHSSQYLPPRKPGQNLRGQDGSRPKNYFNSMRSHVVFVAVLAASASAYPSQLWTPRRAPSAPMKQRWEVPCSTQYNEDKSGHVVGCHPDRCGRAVHDDFLSKAEVAALRAIVDKGMAHSHPKAKEGGPTIMDINSGFVRDQHQVH
jgi:hypothetical protein